MFKNIALKTVYERRWGLLAWKLGLFAMTIFIMLLFPTLKETFGQALNDVPDSLKGLLGDAQTYQRINGFIDLQVFAQMVFMTIIYAVILFTGVLAGDENEGTLQTLLSHPVSRTKVYSQKLMGAGVLLALVCLSIFIGTWVGAIAVGESVNLWRLGVATDMMFLVTLVFGAIGFMLSAITGKRGLSGAIAGTLAFVSYLTTSLAPSVKSLKTINKFSPFEYFNKPSILDHGVQLGDFLILTSIVIFCIVAGHLVFRRRDIPQK